MKKEKMGFGKKKVLWIAGIAVAVVAVAAMSVVASRIPVTAVEVTEGTVIKSIKETGTVESKSAVTVYAKAGGDISTVLVEEGQSVTAGDLLIAGDTDSSVAMDIQSIRAQAAAVQAQYNQARSLADKNKLLYEEGAISEEIYSQSQAAAKQLKSQMDALNYSAQSVAEASGAKGIEAPIDGIITGVFVKKGDTTMAGAPLFEISNLNDIYVKAELVAEDADKIQQDASAWVSNKDSGFEDKQASVRKIELKARESMSDLGIAQKRVAVEIQISDGSKLRLGSDVDVELIVEERSAVLRVPKEAVFQLDEESRVYVVEGGKARLTPVTIGLEGNDYTEILSGLEAGQFVIKSPANEVEDGTSVKRN